MMKLSKTQVEIMKIFVAKINEKFSIKQVSQLIKKPYPLIHRSIKPLIENNTIYKDEHGLLFLNYKEHHQTASYVESLRAETFLQKNKTIGLFVKDVLDNVKINSFIFLVFGSSARGKIKPNDIDIMLIVPDETSKIEKIVDRIASNFSKNIHSNTIGMESAREMLSKRDKLNVMNETLNSHIILYGAENYYRLLKYAR